MPASKLHSARAPLRSSPAVPTDFGADSDRGFGIYVHWPFCKAKCPYCDFNSHVRREPPDQKRYAAALLREMAWFAERTQGKTVSSIFFGGGTPSLMHPQTVEAVIAGIRSHWPLRNSVEISLEANPTSVEADNFRGYAQAGVNRVSLGVQALNEASLKALGRQHSVDEALAAFQIARDNFERVSFDLIYTRPQQTIAQWQAELSTALKIAVDHLSLYQLTIEPGTAYYDLHQRGKLAVPDDDIGAEFYEVTQSLCDAAGLNAYEISNHADEGAQCLHNLIYWRGGDWAGIGPGAHGRIEGRIGGKIGAANSPTSERIGTSTQKNPEIWLSNVEKSGQGLISQQVLSRAETADEVLLMGLRLSEGVDVAYYESLGGKIDKTARDNLTNDGLIDSDAGSNRLWLTPKGRLLANGVIAALAG